MVFHSVLVWQTSEHCLAYICAPLQTVRGQGLLADGRLGDLEYYAHMLMLPVRGRREFCRLCACSKAITRADFVLGVRQDAVAGLRSGPAANLRTAHGVLRTIDLGFVASFGWVCLAVLGVSRSAPTRIAGIWESTQSACRGVPLAASCARPRRMRQVLFRAAHWELAIVNAQEEAGPVSEDSEPSSPGHKRVTSPAVARTRTVPLTYPRVFLDSQVCSPMLDHKLPLRVSRQPEDVCDGVLRRRCMRRFERVVRITTESEQWGEHAGEHAGDTTTAEEIPTTARAEPGRVTDLRAIGLRHSHDAFGCASSCFGAWVHLRNGFGHV